MRYAKLRSRVRSRPSRSKSDRARKTQGDKVLRVDDIDEPLARRETSMAADSDRKRNRYHFDRHTPEYRLQFEKITEEMHTRCPMAWTDTYGGHWVAAGSKEVFELAR